MKTLPRKHEDKPDPIQRSSTSEPTKQPENILTSSTSQKESSKKHIEPFSFKE